MMSCTQGGISLSFLIDGVGLQILFGVDRPSWLAPSKVTLVSRLRLPSRAVM